MPILEFPDPNLADEDGILAVGGDLHPDSLLLAYRQGIFPWPVGRELAWFSPDPRAILPFDEIHLPRSLKSFLKKHPYRLSVNEAFPQVIAHCAKVKRNPITSGTGTWISPALRRAYEEFHSLGHAHSVEVWEGPELVGGIYGVLVGGAFAGESMFHLKPNTSKLALLHLVDWLKEKGLTWMDIQVMTPHMERLGARGIPRKKFLKLLKDSQKSLTR